MGDGKTLAEVFRHIFNQQTDRDGGRIGRHHTILTDDIIQPVIEVFFNIKPFNHRFDNPVTFRKTIKVISCVACLDQISAGFMHQGWRV